MTTNDDRHTGGMRGANDMIEHTREFICLSICLNYAKAARQLHISQPSLSRHIAELEAQLGFKLFDRNPMALTAAGKYYLESMSEIINQIDTVIAQGKHIANGAKKSLVISMVPFDLGVYSNVIYESVANMRETFPGFSAQYYSSRAHTIYETVISGEADVGVLFAVPEDVPEGMECTLLMEYPYMVWAHKDNPAVSTSEASLFDFADCKLVNAYNKTYNAFYDAELAVMEYNGIHPETRIKDAESMADFFVTMQPDEIKITSEASIRCPYNPNVVGVHLVEGSGTFPTYLFYRKSAPGTVLDEFIQTCLAVGQRFAEQHENYSFSV